MDAARLLLALGGHLEPQPQQQDPESARQIYGDAMRLLLRVKTPAEKAGAAGMMKRAAELGHAAAMYTYAEFLLDGSGVPVDEAAAILWFKRSFKAGHAAAGYRLAVLYHEGIGVEQSLRLAAQFAIAAADRGSSDAAYLAGAMYLDGLGVKEDPAKAFAYYLKAATEGKHTKAQFSVFRCYQSGIGVKKDVQKGLMFLREAAAKSDPSAMCVLGEMMVLGSDGVEHEPKRGILMLEKSGLLGCSDALCALAEIYAKGDHVSADDTRARQYYNDAAAMGNAAAQCQLANWCRRGRGGPKNLADSVRFYRQSGENEDATAQYAFAKLVFFGEASYGQNFVPEIEALECVKQWADDDNPRVKFILAVLLMEGRVARIEQAASGKQPTEREASYRKNRDRRAAVDMLGTITCRECPEAIVYLARCYGRGDGVGRDCEVMFKLLQVAVDDGCIEAGTRYAECQINGLRPPMPEDDAGAPRAAYDAAFAKKEGFKALLKYAELGSPHALYSLGSCYLEGNHVNINIAKGQALVDEAMRIAAEQNAIMVGDWGVSLDATVSASAAPDPSIPGAEERILRRTAAARVAASLEKTPEKAEAAALAIFDSTGIIKTIPGYWSGNSGTPNPGTPAHKAMRVALVRAAFETDAEAVAAITAIDARSGQSAAAPNIGGYDEWELE
jgi:TPR repeat protein